MTITKADWKFVFDDSISDRNYEEQFRILAQRYYQRSMSAKTNKGKQLTLGEKILEEDKDRWIYKDLLILRSLKKAASPYSYWCFRSKKVFRRPVLLKIDISRSQEAC